MTELPKVTLKNYQPVWEDWIKRILREIDRILKESKIVLSKGTCLVADDLEFMISGTFSHQSWNANLMEILDALEDSLMMERDEQEVQRALDLTQRLMYMINPD
jgi:hypothetical protein